MFSCYTGIGQYIYTYLDYVYYVSKINSGCAPSSMWAVRLVAIQMSPKMSLFGGQSREVC